MTNFYRVLVDRTFKLMWYDVSLDVYVRLFNVVCILRKHVLPLSEDESCEFWWRCRLKRSRFQTMLMYNIGGNFVIDNIRVLLCINPYGNFVDNDARVLLVSTLQKRPWTKFISNACHARIKEAILKTCYRKSTPWLCSSQTKWIGEFQGSFI